MNKERVNNAEWCCNEIETLIKCYKTKCSETRAVGHVQYRAKALVYHEIVRDLEKILYGESDYE